MIMFGLKKFLFRSGAPEHLPEDVRAGLDAWREVAAPSLEGPHFHTRYVVVDVATSGTNPEADQLLGIATSSVHQSAILPGDALYIDFAGDGEAGGTVERQLLAFLQYAAKAPLVTYHVPFVGGFLQRAFKERLGVDFQPQWIDLAWLLPSMFPEKNSKVMPLDQWIESFGLDVGSGRRDAMENSLLLARIFQMLLIRASSKEIESAAKLIGESRASSFLRRIN
jgi:DNA polymerase III subunit epsilon